MMQLVYEIIVMLSTLAVVFGGAIGLGAIWATMKEHYRP